MPVKYPMTKGKAKRRYKTTKRSKSKTQKMERSIEELKQQMDANKCCVDLQINNTVSGSWSNISNLFGTAQGDDYGSRQGLNILGKTLSIRGLIKKADTTNRVRLVVVMFESSDDNSIENVMQYNVYDVTYPNSPLNSPYKINGDCKYKILADKEYVVDATHAFAKVRMKVNIPSDRQVMKYTTTGLSIPRTNQISILAVSDSSVASHPQVLLNVRQRFLA